MKIELLADYRGVLTNETYYTAGKYDIPGDMPEAHAAALVAAGRGVEEKQPVRRAIRKKTTVTKRPSKAKAKK